LVSAANQRGHAEFSAECLERVMIAGADSVLDVGTLGGRRVDR
jgi:hypothetical protein